MKRRYAVISLILVVISCFIVSCADSSSHSDPSWNIEIQRVSDSASSRGTAYLDSNKIVETDEGIYITYLNNSTDETTGASVFDVMVEKLDLATQSWSAPVNIGKTSDNHGDPTIVIDNTGHIHAVYGGHGVLKYRKSLNSHDISSWSPEEEIKETGILTYPSLIVDGNDTLFLVVRHSWNGGSLLRLYTRKYDDSNFSGGTPILKPNYDYWVEQGDVLYNRSGYVRWYTSLHMDKTGRLHLAFQNYEYLPVSYKSVDTNGGRSYLIGYMYSDDLGVTWQANGARLALPASPRSVEIVDGKPFPDDANPYYGMGRLALDDDGIPHIMYIQNFDSFSRVYIATRLNDTWGKKEIIPDPASASYACQESAFSIDVNNNYYLLLTMVKAENYSIASYGDNSSEILLMISSNEGKSFKTLKPLENTDNVALWLPSMQYYFTGDNYPSFMFLKESKGPSSTEPVHNEIYFGRIFSH